MATHLHVHASRDQLRRICAFVVEAAQSAGLSEQACYHCEVAVEEACSNIIEHGYATSSDLDACMIDVDTLTEGDYFVIWIRDNSPAFNPILYESLDLSDEAAKLEPGGLGIHFFKKLMHDISYTYQNGQNILTLRKNRR